MAKVIKYKFLSYEVNHGTEENPDIEQIFLDMAIICKTQAEYDANLPIAEREAFPGTLDPDVDGVFDEVFDEEQDNASTDDVLNALLGVTV